MAKIHPAKIKIGDYPLDQKQLIEKLGRVINPFSDSVVAALNKGLTVEENLPFEFKTIDVVVDGSGIPTSVLNLNTSLSNFKGYLCVNVIDINNSGVYPLGMPFLSTNTTASNVNIRHITGLTAGITYRLVLMGIS